MICMTTSCQPFGKDFSTDALLRWFFFDCIMLVSPRTARAVKVGIDSGICTQASQSAADQNHMKAGEHSAHDARLTANQIRLWNSKIVSWNVSPGSALAYLHMHSCADEANHFTGFFCITAVIGSLEKWNEMPLIKLTTSIIQQLQSRLR